MADTDPARKIDELDRWAVYGGIEAGIFATTAEAAASGTDLVGPRATNLSFLSDDVGTVIPSFDGEGDVLTALIGINLGAMAPAPFDVPSRPRPFFDVSLVPAITQETSIARRGDPGEFFIQLPVSRGALFVGERFVGGTGTLVSSQHQGLQIHAALGTAFTFDWEGHRIRIKPAVQYSRIENKVSVQARRAVRIVNTDPLRTLAAYRLIALEDDFTEVYHGVGPSFEIEYDTDETIGPFRFTLFMKGAGSHLFGDLKTEFLLSNPEFPAEQVRFRYKNDRWAYQASIGVRLRLVLGDD